MTPYSLLMKLRHNWPLILAVMALIIAIGFLLFPQPSQDYPPHGFGQTVNYWELVNRPAQSYSDFGVCLGFWVLVPFAALYIWRRRKRPLVPIAVFVMMLVASLMMCSSAARSIPSVILKWEDRGTVQFDNHIYHLARFEYSRSFDIWATQFELYECDFADTQCQQYWTVADTSSFVTAQPSKASITVDEALNQLQVVINDKIALRLDPAVVDVPEDLFPSVPITLDNVEKIADQFELNGRGGDELAWSPSGDKLASLASTGYLWLYSFRDSQSVVHSLSADWYLNRISFNRTGTLLAATDSTDGDLWLWNPVSEEVVQKSSISDVGDVAFSSQADILAYGRDREIVLQDTVTNKEIAVLKDQNIHSLTFSPNGSILVATVYDDENSRYIIHLWDIQTKTLRSEIELEAHRFYPSRIVFSPDGKSIAYVAGHEYANSESGSQIRIWNIANQTEKLHIDLESGQWVNSVAFNHDGMLLVAGRSDGVMDIWNPDSGELVLSRSVGQSGINSIAFNPDGNVLAIASSDGAVHLWSVKP